MTDTFREMLDKGLKFLNIEADEAKPGQLYDFYMMLEEKNKSLNLTSITDEAGVIYRHFVDSLSIVKLPEVSDAVHGPLKVLDVGTGGGMPGLVLKIVFPGLDVTLMDASRKKLDFLDEAISYLGLEGVRTIHARAEDLGHEEGFRESFDLVTCRAVAKLPVISEYCIPFLRLGGVFVAYKSADCREELAASTRAMEILGGRVRDVCDLRLPEIEAEHCLLTIVKERNTSEKYPRRVGIPRKRPL